MFTFRGKNSGLAWLNNRAKQFQNNTTEMIWCPAFLVGFTVAGQRRISTGFAFQLPQIW
jgi:hypothetical protein